MTTTTSGVARSPAPAWSGGFAVWCRLSIAAAILAAVGNIVGLLDVSGVYGKETPAFVYQAVAQDAAGLALVSPTIVVLALLARRGSLGAYLMWLGALAFTTYNYVIYTFSIHVGALFLPWVAVLGLSTFALIGGLSALDARVVRERFGQAPLRLVGWFLIVMATLFTLLWLKDLVPAILAGESPAAASELALPSSPVHVLDLSFFLPVTFATGALLLRRSPWAYTTAPGLVVFLALTGIPIIATPFIAEARGGTPVWAVLPPIALAVVASLGVLVRWTRAMHSAP